MISPDSRLRPGLVSVSFRALTPAEIVDLSVRARLEGIEWGGDVHVPHGNAKRAREVQTLTQNAGLQVAAYGSYYRVGESDGAFERALESAQNLGAPLIRVWAGTRGAPGASDADFARVAEDARRIADLAGQAGIVVALEWHDGTLTETPEGAARVLRETDHPNLKLLWQPNLKWTGTLRSDAGTPETPSQNIAANLAALRGALPHLENLHVYHWTGAGRHALEDGETAWREYLDLFEGDARSRWALLEFVRDDAPEQLLSDAQTLRNWLEK